MAFLLLRDELGLKAADPRHAIASSTIRWILIKIFVHITKAGMEL